ncbi:hypothetical protein GF351_01685 [Candidatus Woesearchaeota archaeon]|nr:hypothetical protein [Candidatus Woesearchaeota archaeon]
MNRKIDIMGYENEPDKQDLFKAAVAELYLADRRKHMVYRLRKVGIRINDIELEEIIAG